LIPQIKAFLDPCGLGGFGEYCKGFGVEEREVGAADGGCTFTRVTALQSAHLIDCAPGGNTSGV